MAKSKIRNGCLISIGVTFLFLPFIASWISNHVFDAFESIDSSLEKQVLKERIINDSLTFEIKNSIQGDLSIQEVHSIFEELITSADSLILALKLGNPKSTEIVERIFFESGGGKLLKGKIESSIVKLEKFKSAYSISLNDPFPLYQDFNENKSSKSWEEFKFRGMPAAPTIATLRNIILDCEKSKGIIFRQLKVE